VVIEDSQHQSSRPGIFETDKSGRSSLIFFQLLIPCIVQEHRQVNKFGREVVNQRGILFSPDRSDLQVSESLVGIEQFARKRV